MIGKKTVVYTSGTFDMLHINHLRLIEYAKGLKNRFPFVTFDLMEGKNWGEMKLVQSF